MKKALIPTEEEAWDLAIKFARKAGKEVINIYVVDRDFKPVSGYERKTLRNSSPPPKVEFPQNDHDGITKTMIKGILIEEHQDQPSFSIPNVTSRIMGLIKKRGCEARGAVK